MNSWLDDAVSFNRAKPGTFDGYLDLWLRDHGVASDQSIHANCKCCWELFDVLHGHRNMLPEKPANAAALTVFRDPVSRTQSQFHDLAAHTEADFRHIRSPSALEFHKDSLKMSFADLGQKWGGRHPFQSLFVDYMCRIFLSRSHRFLEFMALSPRERFESSRALIESRVDAFGFTEKMGHTIQHFSQVLGLYPRRSLPQYNVRKSKKTAITSEDKKYIKSITTADQMLYDYFFAKFERLNIAYSVEDFEKHKLPDAIQRVEVERSDGRITYDMNSALLGEGYWGRDGAGRPECCRWSGPEAESTLYIPSPPQGEVLVELIISGWMSADSRASMRIKAWDNIVEHRIVSADNGAEAVRFRALPRDGVLKLQIRSVAKTDEECRRKLSDGRRKGFALSQISLAPI